ncbi:MAG: NADPH-dependent glutamate synthase [Promethearchaeota archaeon]
MIEQSPKDRTRNFKEVPKGYTSEMALLESNRCLQCGKPSCITGCPVNVDIPGFIRLIRKEKFREAAQKILETSSLPAVCGRVCPQESQCEGECLLGKRFKPIAIGNLERFVADYERNHRSFFMQKRKAPTGKKVAVLGCGPSSLTAAGDLIKLGYDVTIYEAFHKGGGVLAYGIPEFRLPKSIVDSEIEYIKSLGVNIEYNVIIGKTLTFDDLKAMGYSAIFIGIGAGLPMFLGIPGENLKGITSANEFLTRTNLMKAYRFPEYNTPIRIGKIVTVIGGGNVVLDSARTALRLGAEKVIVIYRRSEVEMPARKEEYHHALEEGVVFQFLTNPVRFIGDENDDLKQMEVIKMELGEPDESGRRRPIPIENSEYMIDTDTVIIGIGTRANPIITKSIPELKISKRGYIETDKNCQTNIEEIFAGGDIVTGSATVISAMGAGKRAAQGIDKFLQEKYLDKK